MNISNFDNIRAGSGWPQCIDVQRISGHESYGVVAVAHSYGSKHGRKIQLRKTETAVGLFNFMAADQEQDIPNEWKHSVVIWEIEIPPSAY